MSPHKKKTTVIVLSFALGIPSLNFAVAPSAKKGQLQRTEFTQNYRSGRAEGQHQEENASDEARRIQRQREIEERDREQNGISVGEPRVFDDAILQQMLQVAEARLAALQVLEQKPITDKLGALTGASQQISSFGLNVQGAPLPEVSTATKLPTETTTQSQQATPTGTTTNLQTVSGLATEDVTTKRGTFGPPGATAPSPTTTLPSTGFSVSSSDILNEQMQLTAEINGLRLMLAGDLSGHFIKNGDNTLTKLKTTLGFPITVIPDERHKDAVAVVEVDVVRSGQSLSNEPPLITALLPREKTYNVASITDKSTSIGGGVATQLLGVSGSWLRGHKTYYLVQDQDTLALASGPLRERPGMVRFAWEFRPVLGRRYIRSGLRQTFVQLAFSVPGDAKEGEIGKATVWTYWRKYDRKRGIHKEMIPGSLSKRELNFDIPRYNLAVRPPAFNSSHLENLGAGQMLVKLNGRFLPGTYVRIGATSLTAAPRFIHEHFRIRFTAPISDLATKEVFLVAHDGTEVPLELKDSCGSKEDKNDKKVIIGKTITEFVPAGTPVISTLDETNSLVKVKFAIQVTTERVGSRTSVTEAVADTAKRDIPALALTIGPRTFVHPELQRDGTELSVVVPTAVLVANPKLTLQTLFPTEECRTDVPLPAFTQPSQTERLVVFEQGGKKNKFLLYGTRLRGLSVIAPEDAKLKNIGQPSDADRLVLIELDSKTLDRHKQLLVQRPGERPFLIAIPELAPKKPEPPKAKERVTVNSDEAVIEGDGMKELEGVTFRGQPVTVEIVDDKSIRLSGLRALGATSDAATQTFTLQFKSGTKPKVNLDVVNTKVETVAK